MIEAPSSVEVLTLFVEDLAAAGSFYGRVFGPEVVYQDDVCSVMKIGTLMINVLDVKAAPELVEPLAVAGAGLGASALLTISVKDADAVCADLARHGVKLLNGPVDRPWGRRTAAFADPAGHVWEVAQDLSVK